MTKKKTDVKLTDLEASNSEDVKGGGAVSVNTNPLQNINVGVAQMANNRPKGANFIPGANPKIQRGPR